MKGPEPDPGGGASEALRSAIERTFAATAGSAADTRERAGELLDDVARRGQEARDEVARRGQEARDDLSRRGRRPVTGSAIGSPRRWNGCAAWTWRQCSGR